MEFPRLTRIGHAISDVFQQVMTGKDKTTHDIGRWSWFLCTLTITVGAGWNAVAAKTVDLWILTQCLVAIVGAHGIVLFAKRDTEPRPETPIADK